MDGPTIRSPLAEAVAEKLVKYVERTQLERGWSDGGMANGCSRCVRTCTLRSNHEIARRAPRPWQPLVHSVSPTTEWTHGLCQCVCMCVHFTRSYVYSHRIISTCDVQTHMSLALECARFELVQTNSALHEHTAS
jgi:hypothetical protein